MKQEYWQAWVRKKSGKLLILNIHWAKPAFAKKLGPSFPARTFGKAYKYAKSMRLHWETQAKEDPDSELLVPNDYAEAYEMGDSDFTE